MRRFRRVIGSTYERGPRRGMHAFLRLECGHVTERPIPQLPLLACLALFKPWTPDKVRCDACPETVGA